MIDTIFFALQENIIYWNLEHTGYYK